MNEIDASLRRLQLDHVDLYQIHGVDQVTPLEETLRALEDLVRSGKSALPRRIESRRVADRQSARHFRRHELESVREHAGLLLDRRTRARARDRAGRTRSGLEHSRVEPARRRTVERQVQRRQHPVRKVRAARRSTFRPWIARARFASSKRCARSRPRTAFRSRASRSHGCCSSPASPASSSAPRARSSSPTTSPRRTCSSTGRAARHAQRSQQARARISRLDVRAAARGPFAELRLASRRLRRRGSISNSRPRGMALSLLS